MPAGDTAVCHGNGADHCCYLGGQVCPYLRDDGPQPAGGRRWVCSLFEAERALRPSGWKDDRIWQNVHDSPEYLNDVAPLWQASGWVMQWLWDEGVRCGTWPDSLRGITVTPGDPDYDRKRAYVDLKIAQWQEMNDVGPQWPKFEFACCYGGRPEETA